MESHCFYGVDVSQRTLEVADAQGGAVAKIEHTEGAVRSWLKQLPQGARIAVESTGSLHRLLVRCAIAAGHIVYVLNPRDLSHYARALGRRAKHADAFIAYVGYDPRARDSGQRRGRRHLSKRGSAELRRLLFNAAMSACKTPLWRPFYQRYRDRGLPSTVALVILARKLARIAFSIVKWGTEFNPAMVRIPCARP